MKLTKVLYLLLALAFPVAIFLFLKLFGSNKFEVQPLFSDGLGEVPAECNANSSGQYYVPEKVLNQLHWSGIKELTLFYFVQDSVSVNNSVNRIKESSYTDKVSFIQVRSSSDSTGKEDSSWVYLPVDSLLYFKKCVFFVNNPYSLVLIDKERRIRGFYQLSKRDEVDRLLMELEIILMN